MSTASTLIPRPRSFRVPLGVQVTIYLNGEQVVAEGENLSPTGIFLRSPVAFEQGHRSDIELTIEGESFLVTAEVVRVEPGEGAGLRFLAVPRDAVAAIGAFIAGKRDELDIGAATVTMERPVFAAVAPPALSPAPEPELDLTPKRANPSTSQVRIRPRRARRRTPPAAVQAPPRVPRTLQNLVALVALAAVAVGTNYLIRGERLLPLRKPAANSRPARAAAAPAGPLRSANPAVVRLLAEGDRLMGEFKWTEPPGGSAADRYHDALALEPDNPAALQGLGAIADAITSRARELVARGDTRAARLKYERAIGFLENDPAAFLVPRRDARLEALKAELQALPETPASDAGR